MVLTWAETPKDLDLWIISDDGKVATWWNDQGPNDGVRLDVDNQDGYGPEVITITAMTRPGVYRIVANVYSANNGVNSNGERTCEASDGDFCRFQGLETISFYGSMAFPPGWTKGSGGSPVFSGKLALLVQKYLLYKYKSTNNDI